MIGPNTMIAPRLLAKTVAALLGIALGTTSHAAWETVPAIELSALSDDNLRLLPNDAGVDTSAEAMSLDARLRATATGQRGYVFVEPRVRADQYSGDQNETLNGTDTFVRARGGREWTKVALDFFADYDRQDIRDAEVTDAVPDDPNFDDPVDPDTGLVVFDEDRIRTILSPSLDIRISDRSSLVFATERIDVSYTGEEFEGRVDFESTEVSAGVLRRVDARNEVSARLVAAEYVAGFNANETKTFGVEGGFARELNRDWVFNLTAGVSRSDYEFVNERLEEINNADTSFTYSIGLRQRGERNTINIDLGRETSPNSGGFLTLRDELHVYWSRAMTQRLRSELGVRGYMSKTLDDVVVDDERDYLRVDLGMEWAMTAQLFLNGGYSFTSQKFAQDSDEGTSNSVYVGFAYRGRSRP
jgi:hypothetical protein